MEHLKGCGWQNIFSVIWWLTVSSDWLLQVMEAEHTKTRSELVHKETAAKYTAATSRMKQLEKKLKRTINKSK